MNFKNDNTKTTVEAMAGWNTPTVLISKIAAAKMFIYIDECKQEVGWLGIAHRENMEIFLEDVMLFPQEVHATTTEISPEGLATFGEQLLIHPNGMEIWNNIRVWGHSHVNMAVFPSGQDDDQMKTFMQGGHPWFLRLIANKKGELRFDLFDYQYGLIYKNLPWDYAYSPEELNLLDEIDRLEAQYKKLQTERYNSWLIPIQEEMKVKVQEKKWQSQGTNWVQNRGQSGNGQRNDYTRQVITAEEFEDFYGYNCGSLYFDDVPLVTASQVYDCFKISELEEIGKISTWIGAKGHIANHFAGTYSDKEVTLIWETAKDYVWKVGATGS